MRWVILLAGAVVVFGSLFFVVLFQFVFLFQVVVVETQSVTVVFNFGQGQLRQVSGDSPWHGFVDVSLCEDDIDFFQGSTCGFWVEEVNDWEVGEVDACEEQVTTPAGVLDEDWREHDDGEVTQPVGTCGQSVCHGTDPHGGDFWWVDPWQRQDGHTEEDDEQEQTDGGTLGVGLGVVNQTCKGDGERDTLSKRTNHKQLSSTQGLDQEEGWDRG